ncbi:NAD(P)-binding protein [Aulographum hederae CBS 113979]|uniref:NAD(P)-binding protein n=1 Tax=Aulographum hederae CBS 113979 TaxID=1176131 RepID=A0A6G1H0F2_9PEZI|nr:NAD(P)-binding protein [Aulographum hederae CBS 113979]
MSPLQPPAPLPTLFITGALGYIGGTFLTVLKRSQPSILVRALVRDSAQADILSSFYGWTVTPVIGSLDDFSLLQQEAAKADIVIQGCGDYRDAVVALMQGTTLNPKHKSSKASERPIFIQISGSSSVGGNVLGENSPRVWSDVADWDDMMVLDESRTSVRTDKAVRKASAEMNVRALTLAPPTIIGRGLGAGRIETHQRTMYDFIMKNGAVFLGGEGTNAWSTLSIEDLGRACVFLLEEAMKGDETRVQFGENGYYFIEAFELSLADRTKACAERLYKEGKIATPEVQMKTVEEIKSEYGVFAAYLFASSCRIKADKLRSLGWKPLDLDWSRMVQEAPGYRC